MSPWRAEAFARFPELVEDFGESEESPYAVWSILWVAFALAYQPPRNDDMIQRVYEYCHWCLGQPKGTSAEDDLGSCICVCFFEDIPTLPEAVEDMPRWWSRADVIGTRQVLSYVVGEEGFAKILARFDRPSDTGQRVEAK